MKKLYTLVLILLGALYITSCGSATEKCKKNSDCDDGDKCYAGYCSGKAVNGHQFFDVKLKGNTSNEALTCEQTLVDMVKVSVYRDDFQLMNDDQHGYSYQYELSCKDIVTKNDKYFYIGGNKTGDHQLNEGMGPLKEKKNYKVKFEFLKGNGDVLDTKNVEVKANTLEDPTLPKAVESVNAKLEKVIAKPLKVKWDLRKGLNEYTEGSDEICFENDAEHRDNIMSFYVRLVKKYYNLDPICDANNTNCNFQSVEDLVSCNDSDAWNVDFTVNEATDYILEIYATDKSDAVMYQKTIEFDIPQADLDNASETNPLENYS